MRPLHGAGIHQRIFGYYLSSLTGTLPPLALRPALPGSTAGRYSRGYYGGSAPPAPSAGVAPIPGHPSRMDGARGTDADGSHVHCCPVDGLGTRLYPCGIATATPQPIHRDLPSQD